VRNEKGRVPLRYWTMWWALIVLADFIFYVVLTPIWIGLRVIAWLAEFRARRRR
jgi:lauroyl/myristoyl acyltransferase